MHTFKIVKEQHGWAVRLGEGMMTPFRTQLLAIQEANALCDTLRGHGVAAEVVMEDVEIADRKDAGRFRVAQPAVEPRRVRPVRR